MRLFRASPIPAGIVALGALLLLAGMTSRHAQAPIGPETIPVQASVHSSSDAATGTTAPSTPWTVIADVRPSDAEVEERPGGSSFLVPSVSNRALVSPSKPASAPPVVRAPSCATLCVFLC